MSDNHNWQIQETGDAVFRCTICGVLRGGHGVGCRPRPVPDRSQGEDAGECECRICEISFRLKDAQLTTTRRELVAANKGAATNAKVIEIQVHKLLATRTA